MSLENCKGFSILDGGGNLFPPARNVNENILESDFVPLCDGTTRHRSLTDLRLLEGI